MSSIPIKLAANVAHGTQTVAEFDAFNAQIAPRRLDNLMFFTGFDQSILLTYMKTLATAENAGIIIALDPVASVGDGTLGQVVNGSLDSWLATQAATMNAWGHTVVVRLAHEFNGSWHTTWGTFHETASSFIAGWQYMVNYFASAGVTNIKWAWNPNVWGGASEMDPTTYYPGDAYVDIIGLDGYLKNGQIYKSPSDLFLTYYNAMKLIAPTKPVYIFETGVAEDPAAWDKATWFTDLFAFTNGKFDSIGYWNRFESSDNNSDYTIDSTGAGGGPNAAALAAFQFGVNNPPMVSGYTRPCHNQKVGGVVVRSSREVMIGGVLVRV